MRHFLVGTLLALALLVIGCRTMSPAPTVNLDEPGWTIRHGQAVWQPDRTKPEIAGDILVATKHGGFTVIQFTKTPFTLMTAQCSPSGWQIEFPAENKRFSGRGSPPTRLSWLHLANAILGTTPPTPWSFTGEPNNAAWRLHHGKTGETIEGFLNP